MNRFIKVFISVLVIVIAAIIALVMIFGQNKSTVNPNVNVNTSNETEMMPEIEVKKNYTGYCAIYGKYKQRYVECTGDYDPDARSRAEAKARECNESDMAVHGCTDRYY